MQTLFEIETEHMVITWQGPENARHSQRGVKAGTSLGHLRVTPRRTMARPLVRRGLPSGNERDFQATEGPCLFEETLYYLFVRAKRQTHIEISHRDPTLMRAQSRRDDASDIMCAINFGSQVGYSTFTVLADGTPEIDFEVEVFPSKIEYKSDYEQMLADITNFLMGLSLEYLRATYRSGKVVKAPSPTELEWLTILRHVIDDLEKAIRRVELRPHRRLMRERRHVRPEKSRRADAATRRALLRGQGRGPRRPAEGLGKVAWVREYIQDDRAVETLDTPEHRWLRSQLLDIRRRITTLISDERGRGRRYAPGKRGTAVLIELKHMESRIANLLRIEPLQHAVGEPPANFSSLVLQATAGYREAYATCLILRLGLRLEGGPFQLSLKDISALYEYWCYLSLLKLLAEELNTEIDPKLLFRKTTNGVRVDLERGVTKRIDLHLRDSSHTPAVSLSYNPVFRPPTGTQKPDIGFTISMEDWQRPFEIILDAKYRIDDRPEYIRNHQTPGPPEDAVNVLHRYRDAILLTPRNEREVNPEDKRLMILGAVLFPYRDPENGYTENRFFRSLAAVGIGALPFLPSQQGRVRDWLRSILKQSGWSLADRIVGHVTEQERLQWQVEASQPALIAVLRPRVNQMEWVKERRLYYAPLNALGKRRFATKWVAFYQSKADRGSSGAVTHEAPVIDIEVKPRKEIPTPWRPSRPNELQIVFKLGEVQERETPITIQRGMRSFRWASRLSLNRAKSGHELYIETEPEWRLYDELVAREIEFALSPGDARVVDPDDIKGRATFEVQGMKIKYAGAAGFRVESEESIRYYSDVSRIFAGGIWG